MNGTLFSSGSKVGHQGRYIGNFCQIYTPVIVCKRSELEIVSISTEEKPKTKYSDVYEKISIQQGNVRRTPGLIRYAHFIGDPCIASSEMLRFSMGAPISVIIITES